MVKTAISTGCMVAVLSWGAMGVAHAQLRSDKAVYFTFSEPVALPQVTLPAGKYLFRLADSLANRTIVQIYSADGAKLHGMMMTIPTSRNEPPDDPEIRFLETAANQPPAIATYWYPGERNGWEFIYPKDQATRLAQSSKQSVLTTTANTASTEEMRTAELARVTPSGEQAPVQGNNAQAAAGNTQRGEIATDAPAPSASAVSSSSPSTPAASASTRAPASTAAAARDASAEPAMQVARAQNTSPRTSLPATASSVPTVAAVGAIALIAALGFGLRRRVQA